MDIEIQRTPSVQKGKPDPAHILLLDDKGNVKGVISISPMFRPIKEQNDEFRVEIFTGHTTLSHPIDIKLTI